MTVEQAILLTDFLVTNYAYDEAQKTDWLSGLDMETALTVTGDIPPKYTYPEDKETTLLIPAPFDECYILYLKAKMAFFNDETNNYNNFAYAFNAKYDEFKNWYIRTGRGSQGIAVLTGGV